MLGWKCKKYGNKEASMQQSIQNVEGCRDGSAKMPSRTQLATKNMVCLKTLCSKVMASFAYRESHLRFHSDPDVAPSTA